MRSECTIPLRHFVGTGVSGGVVAHRCASLKNVQIAALCVVVSLALLIAALRSEASVAEYQRKIN